MVLNARMMSPARIAEMTVPSRRPRMLPNAASEIRAVLKTSVGSKQTFTIPKRLCVFSAMALTSPSPGFMMTFAVTCRKMPSAELVVFPGVGHGLMYQCPDRFCETVLGFLK